MRNITSTATAILGIAAALQVGAQSTSREADYTNRARQAVESALQKSGQSPGQLRIEVVDGPLLAPDHTSLHRREAALPAGRAKLSGRVVNAAWEPVAGLRLLLQQDGDGGPPNPVSAVTSTTGEFQFPDVPWGRYQIQRGSSSEALTLTLEAGRHRVLLRDNEPPLFIFDPTKASSPFLPAVVMGAYNGANLVRMDGVGFENSQAEILWTVDTATASRDLGNTLLNGSIEEFGGVASLPSEAERKQLREDLVPLLSTLFDVARGGDRLKPFLSSRVICRFYYSGERRLPDIDNQRCASLYLDMMTLVLWGAIEGTGMERLEALDWYSSPPPIPDEQLLAAALRPLEVLRSELRGAGMFEREHSSRIQQALRALAAAVPIARVTINESKPDFPLPRGSLYLIGAPFPIFLAREGRELRVVGVFLGGG